MSDEPKRSYPQPFTPRGVATVAQGSWGILLLWQVIVAAVVAGSLIWFLRANYCPPIVQAIATLPEQATLDNGRLDGVKPGLAADGKFLSLSIQTEYLDDFGTGDVQVKFMEKGVEICSLFGCFLFSYPSQARVALAYSAAGPWWGAWQPVLLAGVGVVFSLFLFVSWSSLAFLYIWPAKFFSYFGDRQITRRTAWRLGSAAQLPAAIFMAIGIVLYGTQALDVVGLLALFGLHFPVAWIYVLVAPFFLDRLPISAPLKQNPFVTKSERTK